MQFVGQVTVVHRRSLTLEQSEAFLLPLLDPIFRIETHMSFEERVELFRLATILPLNFVACEIGSYYGASTGFLATAATLRAGHVHAIDTWHNDAMFNESAEDTYVQFEHNVRPLRHFITIHRGHAEKVKDDIPDLDLLFIDGDHSYAGAKANLVDYVPKLKPGATLILHDYTVDSVARAARDALDLDAVEELSEVHTLKAFRVKASRRNGTVSTA